jgi:hypothetical protein
MPTIENPAVLQETSITFASGIHPGGEASPYAVLRFVAHQRGPDQRMEKLELPPLWVERQALQALADLLVMRQASAPCSLAAAGPWPP